MSDVSRWKNRSVVVINGSTVTLTSKPKRAIDGTWLVFYEDKDGKVRSTYVGQEDVA